MSMKTISLTVRNLARLAALACIVCFSSAAAFAQSGAGSIQGTVLDASGAVIPGASIHVVGQDTGVTYDTTSNSAGFYSVPALFTGNYTVTYSAPSMKKYQTSIVLQVAQNAVLSPKLSPGAVTEQVTVTGNAIQLATYDSGTVSTQLDSSRIDQLPENGRNVLNLAQLTVPGLESGGTRVNGGMPESLEYTQDGARATNRNFGGEVNSSQAQLPDPDSVQEVKVETMNSSAQFSTPATAIITTKSGTNSLHGSLFETARNNAIGVAKPRISTGTFTPPHLVRNEFGASIGGPIVVPHFYNGKDKSFFFFAYERFSLGQSTPEAVTVPTVAMRNGDFSGLVNSSGVLQQLYDPATTYNATSCAANGGAPNAYCRLPFVNNQIPLSRISPLAKNLYAASPLPTSSANPLVASNYSAPALTQQVVPNINFRLDHVVNESNRVYLRFTDINQSQLSLKNYPSNSPATVAGGVLPANASGYQLIPVTTISSALGFTHVFSPTFSSETILSQQWQRLYFNGAGPINSDYEQILGLPNNFGQSGFPNIGSNLIMPYGGSQYNYGMSQILTTFDENLTKVLRQHELHFGGRYGHERFGYLPDRNPDAVNFGAFATALEQPSSGANYSGVSNTGYQDADFFLGAAASYTQQLNAPYEHYTDQEFDTYFQDNFHISKSLTINAGLRWEARPSPKTRNDLLESFDLNNDAIVLAQPLSYYVANGYTTQAIVTNMANLGIKVETPQQAGIPNSMLFDNNFCFSPRLGFAYQPFGGSHGTVVRGGFGRYIYPVPIRNSLKFPAADLPFGASYSQNYNLASQTPDGLPNSLLRAPQTVVAGLNSSNVVSTSTTNSILPGVTEVGLNPHYPPDYVTQGNLTIEQPIKGGNVLRVTYLYDHGTNLDQTYYFNFHPSTYVYETVNGVTPPTGTYANTATGPYDQTVYGNSSIYDERTGYSNDNSLQLQFQRPLKKGIAFQIFYVYSRAFRVGGNTGRDSQLYPAADFAPGAIPAGTDVGTPISPGQGLNHLENYKVDTAIPEHHVNFNGIVDLPVGRGKRFLGNSNRFVDELLGGFQLAFTGQVVSQSFAVAAANFGQTNPIQLYKHGQPITDCRSGKCFKGYQWFNGYIAPTAVASVTGLPAGYVPYEAPINNTPGTANYGNNNVNVTLKNGTLSNVAYSPGPSGVNLYSRTVLLGPFNYNADMSFYKVFPIKDAVSLRINVDAFNAFNIQGNPNVNGTDGTELLNSSYWTPRQIQLSARLRF